MVCNTAYFELLKAAIPSYLLNSHHLTIERDTFQRDRNGSVVGKTYHVTYAKSKNPCCTINLYYTKSKLLVNGPAEKRFLDSHFSAINSSISDLLAAKNISLEVTNSAMKDYLLQTKNTSKPKAGPATGSIQLQLPTMSATHSPAMLAGDDPDHPTLCPHCQQDATSNSILCNLCLEWLHKNCENILNHTFDELSNQGAFSEDDFVCSICLHDMEDTAMDGNATHTTEPELDMLWTSMTSLPRTLLTAMTSTIQAVLPSPQLRTAPQQPP